MEVEMSPQLCAQGVKRSHRVSHDSRSLSRPRRLNRRDVTLYAVPGSWNIRIAGRDTATPLNLEKRLRIVRAEVDTSTRRVLDCGSGAGAYGRALAHRFHIDAIGVEFAVDKMRAAAADQQTFENISGTQTGLRMFGVSQVLVARKPQEP
jgi:hypothetical protein